jgi:zinc transporter
LAIHFGSRQSGLICGYLFSDDGGGRPVSLDDATAWLAGTDDGGAESRSFVWLHFDLTDASAAPWMQRCLSLPEEFFDALKLGSRSTRIENAQDQLVAVVNDVAYDFTFDPSEIATLWVSVGPRLAVSARTHPLRSVDRLREAVKQGSRFGSSVDLLNHLLRDQGGVLTRIVREATHKVDSIEDSMLGGRFAQRRAELGRLRRVLVRLQRLLAPEPAAMFRLLRQSPPWIAQHDLDEMRQSTEEFSLVVRDVAALEERIKLLQEEIAAQVGEQTNRSLFALTMVTVLALPINITTGFFGMNVGGIPLAENDRGFFVVVLLVVVLTAVAAWIAFRNRG